MISLPAGKLPANVLQELLSRYTTTDPSVIVGSGIGRDAAILDLGDRYLVAKTDPVTYATDEIGWYAVHVNANDVACCGATPRWYLATVLLPEGKATQELTEAIFAQISHACRQLGVAWCGGHTEVVYGLPRAIVVGQMLGEVRPKRLSHVRRGEAGRRDHSYQESGHRGHGAIIVREQKDQLRGVLSDDELLCCAGLLHEPGISVLREAQLAVAAGGVHALHDPTEGGVATGLWELAQASGVGLMIERQQLPLLPQCEILCRHFGLDPLGLIASGGLLIAAEKDRAAAILQRLSGEGIVAAVIGEVVPAAQGCSLRLADRSLVPLPTFPCDEITRLFAAED